MRQRLLVGAALLLLAAVGQAHEYQVGALHIEHPWARAMPPGVPNGAAYLVVHNGGATADRLLGADTSVAATAEIHEHMHQDGLMKMRKVEGGVAIPAGGELALQPMGYHLMLFGLKQPLEDGKRFPLTLHFEQAGDVQVEVAVQKDAPAAAAAEHQH
ncbi:copper resistance protein CopZ [Pseudomonas alcaligenes]|uniref:Copper resistance protein CopZ n=1 Tax=Aquipseudomonas alcaligenes TaxID=43263 RepID=A0ABR7RW46_AQUAC|nr:copper chaperone PCu(A)C [Pseudomonas alcaligenes]MBC9248687.1 copper resistance protein CopZ [Pseudomonas alcaligenes]